MGSVAELFSALEHTLYNNPEAGTIASVLSRLCQALDAGGDGAADELDQVLLDMQQALCLAAAASPVADASVRHVLLVGSQRCTAREVFTLGMAILSEQLSAPSGPTCQQAAHGPASPSFQLFLLDVLARCLQRIHRRPLHFLAQLLHMQLRWAGLVLPALPLGGTPGSSGSASACGDEGPATVASAVAALSYSAAGLAAWLGQPAQDGASAEQHEAARRLLGATLLQLACIAMQLPRALQAAEAAVAAASQAQPASGGAAAPSLGSRLPLMRTAAAALLWLPDPLMRVLAPLVGPPPGSAGGSAPVTPRALEQLVDEVGDQLASSSLDAGDLALLDPAQAAQGAAAAACAAALAYGVQAQTQAQRLRQLLPHAATRLLGLGAQHQSVALTLLPLGALCSASGAVAATGRAAAAGGDCRLGASTQPLDALLAALVAVMSHNPVQLVRSCAHDAVHALLDAFAPAARLAQLATLAQMPCAAAAVVALQRLRLEMAAAWPSAVAAGQQAPSTSPWLTEEALQLALPCLERASAGGWHDEASVAAQADVQAAALSLLRWVLLREAAAPVGLLRRPQACSLLQRDLRPLQACVVRLLQMQAAALAGQPGACGGAAAELAAQEQLDSALAVQRLHEVLGCVVELIPEGW